MEGTHMKTMNKTLLSVAIAGSLGMSVSALAYEQGDYIVRGGAAVVEPQDSSSPVEITQPALGSTGVAEVGVDTNTQVGLSLTYMYTPTVGVELLAATPFSHDIVGAEGVATVGKLAETKHLPPTLTVNYHLNDPASAFQPYIGAGINYTLFFNEEASSTLDSTAVINALASAAAGAPVDVGAVSGTDIDLENSFGLAAHIGFDYQLTDNIGINAAFWRIDINTEAEVTTNTANVGAVKAKVDVEIDPNVYMFGVTYKF
jgi:outer membrane protein